MRKRYVSLVLAALTVSACSGGVQDVQDGGESWGEAVRRADQTYPNL